MSSTCSIIAKSYQPKTIFWWCILLHSLRRCNLIKCYCASLFFSLCGTNERNINVVVISKLFVLIAASHVAHWWHWTAMLVLQILIKELDTSNEVIMKYVNQLPHPHCHCFSWKEGQRVSSVASGTVSCAVIDTLPFFPGNSACQLFHVPFLFQEYISPFLWIQLELGPPVCQFIFSPLGPLVFPKTLSRLCSILYRIYTVIITIVSQRHLADY